MISPADSLLHVDLPSDQFAAGRTLDGVEIQLLTQAINSGTLTSTKGRFVRQLETGFASLMGVPHCVASCSGTAALHTAFAAIDPEPGDEFITTPITDMGALAPILYQTAIPVFADVEPATLNVTAETIEARLSERTKAIVVTHLFGNPCDMGPIMELAQSRNLPVIEDCAQAFEATYRGRKVGTIGDIGCFSLQQGKHITAGEGGLCVTNNDELARRMFLFVNKAWGYGDTQPDHYFLAPNYRMNELTGAVAVAQLGKLKGAVQQRCDMADRFMQLIQDIVGIETPPILPESTHTFWKFCLTVDESVIPGGAVKLAGNLKQHGIFSAPRYIQKPAFECQVFAEQRTFGNSRFPFTQARPGATDYERSLYAGAYQGLEQILVLPWNERYTEEHVDYLASCLRSCSENH